MPKYLLYRWIWLHRIIISFQTNKIIFSYDYWKKGYITYIKSIYNFTNCHCIFVLMHKIGTYWIVFYNVLYYITYKYLDNIQRVHVLTFFSDYKRSLISEWFESMLIVCILEFSDIFIRVASITILYLTLKKLVVKTVQINIL